jgi:hypothetical protein
VSTGTKLWAGQQRKNGEFLAGTRDSSLLQSSQLPNQWVPGDLSQRVKCLKCEPDHSQPSSVEDKNV